MEENRSRISDRNRDLFLYRIIQDKLFYKKGTLKLCIKSPNTRILYNAECVFNKTYKLCESKKLYSDEDIYGLLINDGLWTEDDDQLFDILPKKIDDLKINMFENIRRPLLQGKFKEHLNNVRDNYNKLLRKRHKLDYLSINGVATFAKHQYIISKCTYKGKKLFDWQEEGMYKILDYYYKNIISDETLRDICKSNIWSSMWSSRKMCNSLFNRSAAELTQDQSRLIYWSKLYDNAYEQRDCDPKLLLKDDDLFDGWLLFKQREDKSDQAEKFISNPKVANSQEVFLNANNPLVGGNIKDQAREISNLNNSRARNILKNRYSKLDKEGRVAQQQFKDVQDRQYER